MKVSVYVIWFLFHIIEIYIFFKFNKPFKLSKTCYFSKYPEKKWRISSKFKECEGEFSLYFFKILEEKTSYLRSRVEIISSFSGFQTFFFIFFCVFLGIEHDPLYSSHFFKSTNS